MLIRAAIGLFDRCDARLFCTAPAYLKAAPGAGTHGESVNFVAMKMLVGDRVKYAGIIIGVAIATFLISQQLNIFIGLMASTYGLVTNISTPDVWVTNRPMQDVDDLRPMSGSELYRVKAVSGVLWAARLFRQTVQVRLHSGKFETCMLLGLGDQSLVGGPPALLGGTRLRSLRISHGIIVDAAYAKDKLQGIRPGQAMQINGHRAVVVGLCRTALSFQGLPLIYTTYSRAANWAPAQRHQLAVILVKARPGVNPQALCGRIEARTGLEAYTRRGIMNKTFWYYMKSTGIPINFGITISLGALVGIAIAAQTLYQFTHDNLRYLGTLKAMGATDMVLARMVLAQALLTGILGFGIGIGLSGGSFILIMHFTPVSQRLAAFLPQVMIGTGLGMLVIVVAASLFSLISVIRLEPAVVFK